MKKPEKIVDLFNDYTVLVNKEVKNLFNRKPGGMYGMMLYFMGFTDEKFRFKKGIYGGKRFRSALCLFIADQYGVKIEALPVAVSLEVFHNFTLIHDDIVDRDELRRGRKTVWKLWGNHHAINSGDGQLILAILPLAKSDENFRKNIEPFLLEQYIKVVEGQYLDFNLSDLPLGDKSITERAYFEMIGKKTSVLVGSALQAGGMVAGVSKKEERKLFNIGFLLGLTQQLYDDFVSVWGASETTGKNSYGDIREKKKTLPVLRAAGVLSKIEKKKLIDIYSSKDSLSDPAVFSVLKILNNTDAYEYTRKMIEVYKKRALKAVSSISISKEGKSNLVILINALIPDIKKIA